MATSISSLTTAQIASLSTRTISLLSTEDWAAFSTAQIIALSTAQIGAITPLGLAAIGTEQFAAMETLDLLAMRESYTRQRILLCFNGPISRSLIEEIGNALRNYLERNGASAEVYDLMTTVPNRMLRELTPEELERYGLSGANAVEDDLNRIRVARKCGEDFARRRDAFQRAFDSQCMAAGKAFGAITVAEGVLTGWLPGFLLLSGTMK